MAGLYNDTCIKNLSRLEIAMIYRIPNRKLLPQLSGEVIFKIMSGYALIPDDPRYGI